MKTFLVLLAFAYVRSEKLDLTYLPPPGSQYSGGRPDDIQVPFEFPKETYSTTLRPQDFDSGITNPDDYQATLGVNRGQSTINAGGVTPGPKIPSATFQNTQRVPTTTVSYAFTQTTTYPPTEGFETTIGPQFAGTDYPSQDNFNSFQPQEPGLTYQGDFNQPGFTQTQFGGQGPVSSPKHHPGFVNQPQGSVTIGQNQRGQTYPRLQQNIGQFGEQGPVPTSGPILQLTGSTAQPQGIGAINEDFQVQNRPGYQINNNQFRGKNPTLAPTPGSIQKFTNVPQQDSGIVGQNIYGQQSHNLVQQQPGYQQPISGGRPPGLPFGQSQYQNQTIDQYNSINQPGFVPSTIAPTGFPATLRPGAAYGNRFNYPQVSSTPRPGTPQINLPNNIGAGQNLNDNNVYQQQFPGSQINRGQVNTNGQSVFQPLSTIAPTAFTPGLQNGQFPTQTSVVPGSYPTSGYPQGLYNNQIVGQTGIGQRPERPQADADRNAVIINYENVITPEGFAYTFDTSNGIHADESGTATEGVKAKGSYSYIGDDGKVYSVVYTADENGYQPHGDHLPTPPPIPEAIQEIIEKVKKEKEAGIYHDGSYDEDKYGDKKYHGAMLYKPQYNKNIENGADGAEEYVTETTLRDMKPRRPFTGTRKPSTSSGDLSDFGEVNQEQNQYNDDDETSGPISTQRPFNLVGVTNAEPDGDDQTQLTEVLSKRPFNQPARKPINNIAGSSNDNTSYGGNSRRPVSIGSKQTEDETAFENGSEDSDYEDGDKNTPFKNKVSSNRPTSQKRPQYGQEDITSIENLEYDTSSKRPLAPGSSKLPVTDVPQRIDQQTSIDYEPTVQLQLQNPSRRPLNRPVIGNVQDQFQPKDRFQPGDRYNTRKSGSRPSNKPFDYSDGNGSEVSDMSENEKYVTKSPTRVRPDGAKSSVTSTSQYQSTRRRPYYPIGSQNKDVDYQPEDGEQYDKRPENIPSRKYGNRRPANRPAPTTNDQYEETEKIYGYGPEDSYYNRPKPTFTTKYDRTRVRPQTSGNRGPLQTSQQYDRGSNVPGAKFGQKLIRPSNQQTAYEENNNQRPVNETGYQYIPPKTKFQEKGTRFPVSETTRVPSNRRPSLQNVYYGNDDASGKPFMTPSVSHDGSSLTDVEYDQEDRRQKIVPGLVQRPDDRFNTGSQYPGDETTPDQVFSGEVISSTKPPNKFSSSTYRPSPTTGRPLRPQYNHFTQNVPGVNNVDQQANRRPIQGSDRMNFNINAPYGGVLSTTQVPTTGYYYGSTTPAQQINYVTGNTYQTPGQGIISSTTPLPSSKPTFQGSYQQNTNGPESQSTFGTLRPTEYNDGTSQRIPVTSTYSTSSEGPYQTTQFGNNLPSTTYHPNYTVPGVNGPSTTAAPGVVVDGLGRPIRPGYGPVHGPTGSGQPIKGQNLRGSGIFPGDNNDQFRGPQRYQPDTKPGQRMNPTFQSSTEKIIGENFSGPKQQQKFDPKNGYYY